MQCYYQTDYQDSKTRCKLQATQELENWCCVEHQEDWQEKNYGKENKFGSNQLEELRKAYRATTSPTMRKYYTERAKLIKRLRDT